MGVTLSMRTLLIAVAATMLGLLSGACSTIVSGTDQSVTVITDPAGAECTLERGGVAIAVINPTPGTVQVDKSQQDIAVLCTREEHQDSTGVISSTFESMTFGNILFGGVIGVAIDASSGAMNQYPDSVTIAMVPESFTSNAARDEFFDRRIAQVDQQRDMALASAKASTKCKKDPEHPDCIELLKQIDAARDAEVATLERQRASAVVE